MLRQMEREANAFPENGDMALAILRDYEISFARLGNL